MITQTSIILSLVLVGILTPAPTSAGIREEILSNAAKCEQIASDREWLDCYYGAAQSMRSRLGLPPAPQAQTRNFSATQQDTTVNTRPADAQNLNQISARLISFSIGANGTFTATLSNNQVWQQLAGDTTFAHWTKSPRDFHYNIEITRGALGSFDFRVIGIPGSFKVRRLQ